MLKNIILEIISDKKARNIEPTHALFKEVFDRATIEGIAADDIRKGLNELFINDMIKENETSDNTQTGNSSLGVVSGCDSIKTTWDIRECFKQLRFDKNHHLGLGDIRLTIAQQEEICDLVEHFYHYR